MAGRRTTDTPDMQELGRYFQTVDDLKADVHEITQKLETVTGLRETVENMAFTLNTLNASLISQAEARGKAYAYAGLLGFFRSNWQMIALMFALFAGPKVYGKVSEWFKHSP